MEKRMYFSGWFGFWIFMSVFLVCDTYLFSRGYNAFFWEHKTPEELKIREQLIKDKNEN